MNRRWWHWIPRRIGTLHIVPIIRYDADWNSEFRGIKLVTYKNGAWSPVPFTQEWRRKWDGTVWDFIVIYLIPGSVYRAWTHHVWAPLRSRWNRASTAHTAGRRA